MIRHSKIRILIAVLHLSLMAGAAGSLYAQSTAGSPVLNQAKAVYQFKSFPNDTIVSNTVQFSILAVPNFELSFSVQDSNVFGKETLAVHLVYKNIGNTAADTASVRAILPATGLRFVPGSTGGTISGKTVTWKVLNLAAGKTDSVGMKVIVDSTVIAGTKIVLSGDISWNTLTTSSSQTLIVGNFPRLEIVNTPSEEFVGSGRTVSYRVTVKNTGNVASLNTILTDTVSGFGSITSSSITPDKISSDKKIVQWNLGSIAAFSQKSIVVDVVTQANLGRNVLMNKAGATASNISTPAHASAQVDIVPVRPAFMRIVPSPNHIFGMKNRDSSQITVILRDSMKQTVPDGVPVNLTTTVGTFANNRKTITSITSDGMVTVYLRSDDVKNEIVTASITATGGSRISGTQTDSTTVRMYPGAVTGTVVNGLDGRPYEGAIARVTNSSRQIVGVDTSDNEGVFFIPLNKDVARYNLEIFVVDKFGDTLVASSTIDPTAFPIPPIVIPNVISGRILYQNSGLPVPAEGVTVYLDSLQNRSSLIRQSKVLSSISPSLGPLARVSAQQTDGKGRFKFDNLHPAVYVVSVDSVQYPNLAGANILSDTIKGTFTFNLSIAIKQDSLITFDLDAKPQSNAGDTITYTVKTNNTGNYLHKNITVTDTLPPFTTYLGGTLGKFKSLNYDSLKKIVQWTRDSLAPTRQDSVTLMLLLSRNIPDSTRITNRVWFNSSVNVPLRQTRTTIIKSTSIVSFGNFFSGKDSLVAGDSVRQNIWYANTGTDSLRNVQIVDTLYSAGYSKLILAESKKDSVSIADSIVTIFVGSIPPGGSDTVAITLKTDFGLPTGRRLTSHAHLVQKDSSIMSKEAILTMVENPDLASYLKIVKTGNKKVAEIGDIVTYQVQVTNTSPSFVTSIGVYDLLPHAFKYIKKSARYNGRPIEPAVSPTLNSLSWNIPDTLHSGKAAVLVYQLAIGADALESQGINTAYASAVASVGTQLVSAPSQWQITVRPGVFTEKGLIIGKVFYDDNRNTFQESGENGIKGIELWMEDGTKIVTGDDGKYSLPEVKPGQHVIRVNERTLPKGTELLGGSVDFAGDPSSRFVFVTESGIAKANFFVKRNVKDSIEQMAGRVSRLIGVRQAVPKYLYEDRQLGIKLDTIEMIVSFAYSGMHYLQSIEVDEMLPKEVEIIPNSATYNGRTVFPLINGSSINWKLGRGPQKTAGTLRYKVLLTKYPGLNSSLLSLSRIKVMTSDSVYSESQRLITENIIRYVDKNKIETSEIQHTRTIPGQKSPLRDSVTVSSGDEILFKTSLYLNPAKKITSLQLVDSLESSFIIDERSFTINGIPVPSRLLSMRVRSSALASKYMVRKNELTFLRITSMDLTDMIRSGLNEISYTARLQNPDTDTIYLKRTYAQTVDQFGDTTSIQSNHVKIYVDASSKPLAVYLDTTYREIQQPQNIIHDNIAETVRLMQKLKSGENSSIVMEGITFENGKAILTTEAKKILDNVVDVLRDIPDLKIQINGFTDNTGNISVNLKMSLLRAQEVRKYLISKGINSQRLFAKGFGSEYPIATNKTESGRAKNRRVEFERIQ